MHIFSECLIYICLFMCGSECINCVFIRSTTASQLSCKTVFGVRFNMWLPRCVYSCRNTAAAVADKSLGSSTYSRVTHRYQDSLRVCECECSCVGVCWWVCRARSICCHRIVVLLPYVITLVHSRICCAFFRRQCAYLSVSFALFSLHFISRFDSCARARLRTVAARTFCSRVYQHSSVCSFFRSFVRSFVSLLLFKSSVIYFSAEKKACMSGPRFIIHRRRQANAIQANAWARFQWGWLCKW